MSSLAASNGNDEPARRITEQPTMASASFSSLPNDMVGNIFARVPKSSYPILSCVSKNCDQLVRSPELHKVRSRLGKDSLYICLKNKTNTRQWFTVRRAEHNKETENQLVSVDLVFPHKYERNPSVMAVGQEIYFICGSMLGSSYMWIFDSRTGKVRQGPRSKGERMTNTAGIVGSKMYVIGLHGRGELLVEAFDLKTQTWGMAPEPKRYMYGSFRTVSLDKKICMLPFYSGPVNCYDTRDGSWESFELAKDDWWRAGACVIDNVLYVYYAKLGLLWYDSKLKLWWRLVYGLNHFNKIQSVGMAEYYGKLAFLWTEPDGDSGETEEIWCRMIALEKSEVGVQGIAEASQLLGSVPRGYKLEHCLSLSD